MDIVNDCYGFHSVKFYTIFDLSEMFSYLTWHLGCASSTVVKI
jgi:hypothetical protein